MLNQFIILMSLHPLHKNYSWYSGWTDSQCGLHCRYNQCRLSSNVRRPKGGYFISRQYCRRRHENRKRASKTRGAFDFCRARSDIVYWHSPKDQLASWRHCILFLTIAQCRRIYLKSMWIWVDEHSSLKSLFLFIPDSFHSSSDRKTKIESFKDSNRENTDYCNYYTTCCIMLLWSSIRIAMIFVLLRP